MNVAGTAIPGALRRRVMARDRRLCRYCGRRCRAQKLGRRNVPCAMTFDHVHPVSAGGTSSAANLVVACHWCNGVKGDMVLSVKQFKQLEALALSGRGDEARAMLQAWKADHVAMVNRR